MTPTQAQIEAFQHLLEHYLNCYDGIADQTAMDAKEGIAAIAAAEVDNNSGLVTHTLAAWEDDLQKARAAEREACAQVAEGFCDGEPVHDVRLIAAAIRARKDNNT